MNDTPLHWVRLTRDADWQVAQRDLDGDGWLVIGVPTPVQPAVVGEPVSAQRPRPSLDETTPERAEVAVRLAAHRAATGDRTIGVATARVLLGNLGGTDTGVTDQERNLLRSRMKHETKNFGFPSEQAAEIEILGFVPILWPGWEGHGGVALLRLPNGSLRFYVLDDVDRGGQTVVEILRERLSAYAEAMDRTRAMLALIESQVDEEGKPLPIWDAVRDGTEEDPR